MAPKTAVIIDDEPDITTYFETLLTDNGWSVRTANDPKLRWRQMNDLELFLPEVKDRRLAMGDPILISKKCIGFSAHSGIPSSLVSRGDKVHLAWAEATEPEEKAPGVPTFVVTYDRATGTLGEPALVGYGPPANDVHNTPCITMDSRGYLHVLIGTHGRTFRYARSLEPNDAGGGWTEAEDTLPERFFRTPLREGASAGAILTHAALDEMRAVYYRDRGWDLQGEVPAELRRELEIE